MKCPQCRGYELEPFEIEEGLVGATCAKCRGTMLSLLNYRYWCKAEHVVEIDMAHVHGVEDNHHALVCPKCSRLMKGISKNYLRPLRDLKRAATRRASPLMALVLRKKLNAVDVRFSPRPSGPPRLCALGVALF